MQQNKLFVGNLAFSVTESDLRDAFAAFGELEDVKLITDRDTGRSRGFAFVTFTTQHNAEQALALNGKELGGRPMRVSVATENTSRTGSGGGRGKGGPGGGGGGRSGAGGGGGGSNWGRGNRY